MKSERKKIVKVWGMIEKGGRGGEGDGVGGGRENEDGGGGGGRWGYVGV